MRVDYKFLIEIFRWQIDRRWRRRRIRGEQITTKKTRLLKCHTLFIKNLFDSYKIYMNFSSEKKRRFIFILQNFFFHILKIITFFPIFEYFSKFLIYSRKCRTKCIDAISLISLQNAIFLPKILIKRIKSRKRKKRRFNKFFAIIYLLSHWITECEIIYRFSDMKTWIIIAEKSIYIYYYNCFQYN